jgi:glutamate racemase
MFDSGLGGLTVLQAVADVLPHEDLIYVGDTARYPYGERNPDQLIESSLAIAEFLTGQGAKMIVVACNSATAAALPALRDATAVPVIGVVDPGLRAAASVTRSKHTLVIGTNVTVNSQVYENAAQRLNLDLTITTRACPGLVELVEAGVTSGPQVQAILHERLTPALTARVDTLVLGCTHFPLLAREIVSITGRRVVLVSSADETAFDVRDLLSRTGWAQDDTHTRTITYYTTGDPERFSQLGERFLGAPLGDVRAIRFTTLGDTPLPTG